MQLRTALCSSKVHTYKYIYTQWEKKYKQKINKMWNKFQNLNTYAPRVSKGEEKEWRRKFSQRNKDRNVFYIQLNL